MNGDHHEPNLKCLADFCLRKPPIRVRFEWDHSAGRWRRIGWNVDLLDQAEQRDVVRFLIDCRSNASGEQVTTGHGKLAFDLAQ
jgi:hypothetical protein